MYRHQRIIKTYERFKRQFDFSGTKAIVINIVKDCEVYTRTKALWYKLYREFQTLPVFERTWGSIIINFIVKLLKSKDFVNNTSYNNILVIIDRFTKYSKFIPVNKSHSTEDLADIVVRKIINNHKLPNEFIINRSTTFTSRFFITFTVKFKMNNKLSITFYPQTNGQIERFNQTVE